MIGKRLWRAKKEAERVFKKYEGFNPRNKKQPGKYYKWTEDEIQRVLGIYRKTKVPCSCYMCGNPRRHWGCLPMQEVRQHEDADSQYEEIGWSHKKLRWLRGWLD